MEFEVLQKIVADTLNRDPEEITEEKLFKEDLDADSLDVTEIVMAIEDQYGIQVEESDFENIRTVGDAFEAIQKTIG